jgi:hypothetical protein
VGVSGVGIGEESQPGSSRTLNCSPSADDKFWVPPNLKRQASICHSENADTSGGKFLALCVLWSILHVLLFKLCSEHNAFDKDV